ncbi:MAG: DUF1523 family protein [Alkalilacustris sp.]
MQTFKTIAVLLFVGLLALFMHYTLPRHEVVRIVGATERVEEFGFNRFFFRGIPGGMTPGASRDIRFIETFRPGGRELVFRNEDTGLGWPPFFKINEADIQAQARNLVSTEADPQWVRVTYYGVRIQLFSIFPNALRLTPVDSPDARVIPWTRLFGFAGLIGFGAWLWLSLRRFRERRVEPFLDQMGERRARARGWFGRTWDRLLRR